MRVIITLALIALACGGSSRQFAGAGLAPGFDVMSESIAQSPAHLVHDYPAIDADYVNAVIEIPRNTTAKVEVDHDSGVLRWTRRNGELRHVALPYPGNYGLIPRTLSPRALGGDGDPLDVLVLGAPALRGSVLRVRPIAVLRLRDSGEEDDKIIAVLEGSNETIDRAAIEQFFRDYDPLETAEIVGWRDDPWPTIRAAAEAFGGT